MTNYCVQYRTWGGYGWVWMIALTTESKSKAERRVAAIRREGREVRIEKVALPVCPGCGERGHDPGDHELYPEDL